MNLKKKFPCQSQKTVFYYACCKGFYETSMQIPISTLRKWYFFSFGWIMQNIRKGPKFESWCRWVHLRFEALHIDVCDRWIFFPSRSELFFVERKMGEAIFCKRQLCNFEGGKIRFLPPKRVEKKTCHGATIIHSKRSCIDTSPICFADCIQVLVCLNEK